jgi:voltage-gated potassium channel
VAHRRYTASTTRRIERAGGITPGIAVEIISAVTIVVVFIGALVMWLVDHDNSPNYGRALWWAAQTVTTVGYGDVVPQNTPGKIVAAIVMFSGIALITVVSGAVASGLVQTVRRKRGMDTETQILQEIEALHRRLDDLGAPPRDQGQ